MLVLTILLAACGKNAAVIRTLDDAKHAKLGVMTGTTGEAIAKARFPAAEVKSFDDITDAVAAMKSGAARGDRHGVSDGARGLEEESRTRFVSRTVGERRHLRRAAEGE